MTRQSKQVEIAANNRKRLRRSRPRATRLRRGLGEFMRTAKIPDHCIKCTTCRNPKAAALVREFADLMRAGKTEPWQSWNWFRVQFLEREHGIRIGTAALGHHVRDCLQKERKG